MPSSETERPDHGGAGLAVEEAEPKTKQPPLYQVVLLNDDYTPMEFVVDVLEKFFRMDRTTATRVMLEVLTSIKRAGADMILTYHALDAARALGG